MVTDLKKPDSKRYACPSCGRLNPSDDLIFQGIHILAHCSCSDCKTNYYHTLPLAHAREVPVSFSLDGKSTEYDALRGSWLAEPLINSMTLNRKVTGEIKRNVLSPQKQHAILINCLDDCFGHVFTKLCNISVCRTKNPDAHIIALLPEKLSWLIPEQLNEAWMVQGPLNEMNSLVTGLNEFVKEQLSLYESFSLYASSIYADAGEVDFVDYLHVLPFNYTLANDLPKQVTFILREDRFWHSGNIEEFLFKLCVKFKLLKYVKGYFCRNQNKRVIKTARKLLKEFPDLRITVAGIGASGKLPDLIEDKRLENTSRDDERSWLDLYAKSHVIAGIHGSNMILPGIQAASMIEIVPDYKKPHIGETTLKDYPAKNMCEHVLGYCSPAKLAGIIAKKLTFLENSRLV